MWNWQTLVVAGILAVAIYLVIRSVIQVLRGRKSACSTCSMSQACTRAQARLCEEGQPQAEKGDRENTS